MFFVWRDFVAQFKQTILGSLWYVNPPVRARSCAWAVRQPVSSWLRLLRRRKAQSEFPY